MSTLLPICLCLNTQQIKQVLHNTSFFLLEE